METEKTAQQQEHVLKFKEPPSHSICFQHGEEKRLDELFRSKCHQDGTMDLTHFILLAVERNMISNKYGLDIFYTAFKEAANCDQHETKILTGNANEERGEGEEGDENGSQSVLINQNFFLAVSMLAKAIYGHEENPFKAMFDQMLVDQVINSSQGLVGGRAPKMGPDTFDILSEEAIRVYLNYYDDLKMLFQQYNHQNFNDRPKKIVAWRSIEDQNTTMAVSAFLKMARVNALVPNLLNVEDLHDHIEHVIPPITPEEYKYMENKQLCTVYNQDMVPKETRCQPEKDEPGLLFHEFIFLLGVIAYNCMQTSPNASQSIEDFFVEKLNFDRVDSENQKPKTWEDLMEDEGLYTDSGSSGSELDMDENQKAFMEFLRERQAEEEGFCIDFEEIIDKLDVVLPMIPGRPVVEQVNPDGKLPLRITFGKLMPKEKVEKGDKKGKKGAKAAKKEKLKKGEKQPAPLRWADVAEDQGPTTLDLVRKAAADVKENIFPMNIRAEHSNPGVLPTIIKEVYFPPDAPMEVATLMESSLVYQSSASYEMAVRSMEDSRQMWREIEAANSDDQGSPMKLQKSTLLSSQSATMMTTNLRPEQELYFELSLGSIYESAGKDDIAMSCYMRALDIQLVANHPDEAFAYCGLGSVLYHIDEPAWALRCYLKARQIREERLGGDTVDTAAVYNNAGACMHILERNQESKAYFELAHAIMEEELGPNHERVLTARRNINKAERTVLGIMPQFRQLWTTAVPHPCPAKKKKKKGKKKGKK